MPLLPNRLPPCWVKSQFLLLAFLSHFLRLDPEEDEDEDPKLDPRFPKELAVPKPELEPKLELEPNPELELPSLDPELELPKPPAPLKSWMVVSS